MPENPFQKIPKISETSHEANVGVVRDLLGEEEGSAYAKLSESRSTNSDITFTEKENAIIEKGREKVWDRDDYMEWARSIGKDEKWVDKTFIFENDETVSCSGLDLSECITLTQLPDDLSVNGPLHLSGCTALIDLPNNLSVENLLNLEGCTALTGLPEDLLVGGTINLSGCTALTSLPNTLSIKFSLYLAGCTALTSLPDNFSVGSSLNLNECTALTNLPKSLSVGSLYLKGCIGLTSLPRDLTITNNIHVPLHLQSAADHLKAIGKIGGDVLLFM